VPGIRVFLDVDDLRDIGKLEEYIDASDAIIVFLAGSFATGGLEKSDYFRSANCVREFRQAVLTRKPIVQVLETDPQHGGVALATHRDACPEDLKAAFDAMPVVPWYRVREFQLVSLRLILRGSLQERPDDSIMFPVVLPRPPSCRLYVSPHNEGASTVADMLAKKAEGALTVTSEDPELCERFLLLLDGNGMQGNAKLHAEIEAVLRLREGQPSPLLLVHEQRAEPKGAAVPFDFFFESKDGTPVTPQVLRELGIYKELAVPLYDGEHTEASLQKLFTALNRPVGADAGWAPETPTARRRAARFLTGIRHRSKVALADKDGEQAASESLSGIEMRSWHEHGSLHEHAHSHADGEACTAPSGLGHEHL
jgi:hypothetical protein